MMEQYDWQIKIKLHRGDITIRGGRQSGKSWAVAELIKYRAEKYPGSRHLIIAASERQENYLLEKVVDLIGKEKKHYRGRRTLTRLPLKNGSDIYKFPVGVTGIYIEGLSSIDFIYADEAIHIGWKVWDSILPMLAEPKKRGLGWITLLSATKGRPKGFFFDSFGMKHFEKFVIKAGDQPHISKEFLKTEEERLGTRMFGVIYNGDFDEDAHKYFPKELIKRNIRIRNWNMKKYNPAFPYFLGIDPAGRGRSKAAFACAEMQSRKKVSIIYGEEIASSSLIDLRDKSRELHNHLKFRTIYIDDGGYGKGLIDIMEDEFKYKLMALNNKAASKEGKIFKEDLYSNTLRLLELNQVDLVDDPIILNGLLDVEVEFVNGEERIKGTDMSEAINRALWCVKEKNLKPSIVSF